MAARKTKTAGAVKAGAGKYHFRLANLKKVAAGTGYSTSHGGVVEGARMLWDSSTNRAARVPACTAIPTSSSTT